MNDSWPIRLMGYQPIENLRQLPSHRQDKKPKPLLKKQDTRVKLTRQTLADDPLKLERPKMPSELYFLYDDGKAISGKEEATIKCE